VADWDRVVEMCVPGQERGCRIERARAYIAAGKHAAIAAESATQSSGISADQLFALAVCFAECFAGLDRPALATDSELGQIREDYAAKTLEDLKRCAAAGGLNTPEKIAEFQALPVFKGLLSRPDFQAWPAK
jgi:hypothetical protein